MKDFLRLTRLWPFDWRNATVVVLGSIGVLHIVASLQLSEWAYYVMLFLGGAWFALVKENLLAQERRRALERTMVDLMVQHTKDAAPSGEYSVSVRASTDPLSITVERTKE